MSKFNGIEKTTIEILGEAVVRAINKQIESTSNLVAVDALKKLKSIVKEMISSNDIVGISKAYR